MGSLLILSRDKAIVKEVEKALSPGSHVITVMPPETATLDYSTTIRVTWCS